MWLFGLPNRHDHLPNLLFERQQLSGFQPYRDPMHSNGKPAADGLGVEGVISQSLGNVGDSMLMSQLDKWGEPDPFLGYSPEKDGT